jgi:hypothetical protein
MKLQNYWEKIKHLSINLATIDTISMNYFCGKKVSQTHSHSITQEHVLIYINKIIHNFFNSFMKFINLTKYYEV